MKNEGHKIHTNKKRGIKNWMSAEKSECIYTASSSFNTQ